MNNRSIVSRSALTWALIILAPWLSAQSVYSVLPVDSVLEVTIRSTTGDYFGWRPNGNGVDVMKFDAAMSPLWMKRIDPTGTFNYWNRVNITRTPDGGIMLVGMCYLQNLNSNGLFVIRMNTDGDIMWSRKIALSIEQPGFQPILSGTQGHDVEVDQNGEVFIKMLEDLHGGRVMKLSSSGDLQWVVGFGTLFERISSILPDQSGGCYFVISGINADQYVDLGRLDQNGITQWRNRYHAIGHQLYGNRLRPAADHGVFIGGKDEGDFLCMKFTPSGEPLYFRTFTPSTPYSDCPALFFAGFETSPQGQMVMAAGHNTTNYSFLIGLNDPGDLVWGQKLPAIMIDDWSERLAPQDVDGLDSEVSLRGLLVGHNNGASRVRRFEITSSFDLAGRCGFEPMTFTQNDISIDQLDIEPMAELGSIAIPTTWNLDLTVTAIVPLITDPLCFSTGITHNSPTEEVEPFLISNVIEQGMLLEWRRDVQGSLHISDNGGRIIGEVALGGSSTFHTGHLPSGSYIAIFSTNDGTRLRTERFMVL